MNFADIKSILDTIGKVKTSEGLAGLDRIRVVIEGQQKTLESIIKCEG